MLPPSTNYGITIHSEFHYLRVPIPARLNKKKNAQKSIQQQLLHQWSFFFFFWVVNFGNLATKEVKMGNILSQIPLFLKDKNVPKKKKKH
jgi:hypothetical protein